MNKTLFVHIGLHKTGTTAIQNHFSVFEPFYKLFGLSYPRLGGRLCFRNQDIADDIKQTAGDFSTRSDYLRYIEKSKYPLTLLSAERFCLLPRAPEYFKEFSQLCRVVIVVFVRRQDRYLESLYRQMVKNDEVALKVTFDSYFTGRKKNMNWMQRLAPWEQSFGAQNLLVIPYEEFSSVDSIENMSRILGVSKVTKYLPRLKKFGNSSLSCEAIELLRQLRIKEVNINKERLRAFDLHLKNPTHAYLDPARRQAFIADYAESNRQLGVCYNFDAHPLVSFDPKTDGQLRLFNPATFDMVEMEAIARSCGLLKY
jgi:hypothetical protein